jgi:hypothetical protein
MLLAEGDRDAYRREQAALAWEREIMKDVKGREVRRLDRCVVLHLILGKGRSVGRRIGLPQHATSGPEDRCVIEFIGFVIRSYFASGPLALLHDSRIFH